MANDDLAKYVVKNQANGIYRYYRRVPTEVASLEKRTHIKQSLKTKNLKEALAKAEVIHSATENLWRSLIRGDSSVSAIEKYEAAVKVAQSFGFTYKTVSEVAQLDLRELEQRFAVAEEAFGKSETVVNAVLGTAPEPTAKLSLLWGLYEKYNAAGLTGMSPKQLSKHKVSRERAIRYSIDILGDMELAAVTRADVLRLREWWTKKVHAEGLTAYTANRSFTDMQGMLAVIDEALHTDYRGAWGKARIKETNANKLKKRHPFSVAWVRDRILAQGALDGMNEEARDIVYTMIETGMRLGEVCNLRPQDIRTNAPTPYVEVAERNDRRQKTDHSIRRVPLVGVALAAMRRHPNGFPRYQDKGDTASALINKFLENNELKETDRTTAYSFRHTFQDRIENAQASDRMQADLMGHEFGRPTYGDGAEMARRHDLLESIRFRPEWLP